MDYAVDETDGRLSIRVNLSCRVPESWRALDTAMSFRGLESLITVIIDNAGGNTWLSY
ncbi:hypothetical protein ACWCPI_37635 [Streptomyces sp. NPDC001920]